MNNIGNGIQEQLDALFEKWQRRQDGENPDNYSLDETGISKASFTKDGVVNVVEWDTLEKGKKVLYLMREANGNASEFKEGGKSVDNGEFWFRNCMSNNSFKNTIFKRIQYMQRIILGNSLKDEKSIEKFIEKEKSERDSKLLGKVAYMNINKRGGSQKVNCKILNKYAEIYRDEIKSEICLIKPDIIVCCGTYWTLLDNICNIYNSTEWSSDKDYRYENAEISCEYYNSCKVTILNMYHPSAPMSDKKYIKRFLDIYNGNEKEWKK